MMPVAFCAAGAPIVLLLAEGVEESEEMGLPQLLVLFLASGTLGALISLMTVIPGYLMGIVFCFQVLPMIGVNKCLACLG